MNIDKLNEAFSPSMPEWLRKYFIDNKSLLGRMMRNLDIDPESATFKNYPVPESSRDPIKFDDTKITFYHFFDDNNNEMLHITGLTEDNTCIFMDKNGYKERREIKRIAWGWIYKHCDAICYIDKDDKSNYIPDEKRHRDKSYNKDVRYWNNNNKAGQRFSDDEQAAYKKTWQGRRAQFDKSGYLIDPDRLDKALRDHPELKAKKIKRRFESAYNRIKLAHEALSDALSQIEVGSKEYSDQMSELSGAISYLNEASKSYNEGIDEISRGGITETYYIDRAESYIKKVEDRLDKYIPSFVDWDTDDMYIDED